MITHREDLGAHAAVSLVAGITGAAVGEKLLSLVLAVVGSLVVIFISELFRPWLQRRARKLGGGGTIPPPKMP